MFVAEQRRFDKVWPTCKFVFLRLRKVGPLFFSWSAVTERILERQVLRARFLDSISLKPDVRCGNRTRDGWVRSENATSVLCRPPARQDYEDDKGQYIGQWYLLKALGSSPDSEFGFLFSNPVCFIMVLE